MQCAYAHRAYGETNEGHFCVKIYVGSPIMFCLVYKIVNLIEQSIPHQDAQHAVQSWFSFGPASKGASICAATDPLNRTIHPIPRANTRTSKMLYKSERALCSHHTPTLHKQMRARHLHLLPAFLSYTLVMARPTQLGTQLGIWRVRNPGVSGFVQIWVHRAILVFAPYTDASQTAVGNLVGLHVPVVRLLTCDFGSSCLARPTRTTSVVLCGVSE
jgi:hypothetical protein